MQPPITEMLLSLQNLQQSDGSFLSYTIPETEPIKTTYYTSLILLCLENVPSSRAKESIVTKGIQFLKNNQDLTGSWNYLARTETTHYPDDLDDTFLALTAIHMYEPEFVTPECLVQITNLLIQNESVPGGPYNTWLTHDPKWQDIDTIVNANIYSFLRRHKITLPNLEEYIKNKLENSDLASQYYHNVIFSRYLIKRDLVSIQLLLNDIQPQKDYPFFIEKIHDGITYQSTCPALVIALTIEESFNTLEKDNHTDLNNARLLKTISLFEKRNTETLLINREIKNEIVKLSNQRSFSELFITQEFYDNLHPELKSTFLQESVQQICLMTILGWIGFSIQDDIFDNQSNVSKLPIASSCILMTQEIIQELLFGYSDSTAIYGILHGINEALLREKNIAPATPEEIIRKSAGLIIGPIILIHLLPIKNTYSEIKTIKSFFIYILAVKQVLDDCHDWREDLASGTHTYVTNKLLAISNSSTTKIGLEQLFWHEVFEQTASVMLTWLNHAENDVKKITILSDKKFLYEIIHYYKTTILKALRERADTLAFLESYKKTTIAGGSKNII